MNFQKHKKDLKSIWVLHFFFFMSFLNSTQSQILSGPMHGYVELRTAKIWCEVVPKTNLELIYWNAENKESVQKAYRSVHNYLNFETNIFDLVNLEPGTRYQYEIVHKSKSKIPNVSGQFKTQELWKWRKPAPDFSFITGSCAYQNERQYDRPGRAYGYDSTIFITMANEDSDFMLWLGDNWYTREVDYGSEWGLWYRASRDRSAKVLQTLLKKMSHYAIWDDHDYGPNNDGVSYIFKNETRSVFQAYFANPTYGFNNQGTFTKVGHNDVDLFLMDNRTWRSSDNMPDSVHGMINTEKAMYGKMQMEWLKNALLNSTAAFKIIVSGSQMINKANRYDCFVRYAHEFNDFMDFLQYSKVNGVLFITGDKHISEINKLERDRSYPLYDITVSPLTSGISKINKEERDNPMRISGSLIEEHNYGKFSLLGNDQDRRLVIEFLDRKGMSKFKYEISASDLKNKKN